MVVFPIGQFIELPAHRVVDLNPHTFFFPKGGTDFCYAVTAQVRQKYAVDPYFAGYDRFNSLSRNHTNLLIRAVIGKRSAFQSRQIDQRFLWVLFFVVLRIFIEPGIHLSDGELRIGSTHPQIPFCGIGNVPGNAVGSVGQFAIQAAPIQLRIAGWMNQLMNEILLFLENGFYVLRRLQVCPLAIPVRFQPDTFLIDQVVRFFLRIKLCAGGGNLLQGIRDVFLGATTNGELQRDRDSF